MIYTNPAQVPAIRQHDSANPTTCPWCGDKTWFLSFGDIADDHGRVQMYCDNPGCDSRETELMIVRGERANSRADVQALRMIDDGQHTGEGPPPSSITVSDPQERARSQRRKVNRVEWRQSTKPFSIQPSTE